MTLPQNTPAFFILEIVVLVVFLFGLASDVHFWLKGTVGDGENVSASAKVRLVASGLGRAFRRDALGTIALDWFLQPRLMRSNPLSWLMHMCFFWGLVILYFIGSLGLFLAEKGLLPITKDTPWFAFVDDFAGVMVLFAVGVALYRRFVSREWRPKNTLDDHVLVALLALIVISGYLLEASRLVQGVPEEVARFSFVGYALSSVIQPLPLDWISAEATIWWVHVLGGMAFVAYLPYSKLIHLLAAPISVIAAGSSPAPVRDVARV